MEDRDFFDTLYQGWSKTTGAESTFWMFEEHEVPLGQAPAFVIYAVNQDQEKKWVGETETEEDAAFITAVHGCFGDLVRRLHTAVDEAERFEIEKDNVINEMVELAEENNRLRAQLNGGIVG